MDVEKMLEQMLEIAGYSKVDRKVERNYKKAVDLESFLDAHESIQKLIFETVAKEIDEKTNGKAEDVQVYIEDGMLNYAFTW